MLELLALRAEASFSELCYLLSRYMGQKGIMRTVPVIDHQGEAVTDILGSDASSDVVPHETGHQVG